MIYSRIYLQRKTNGVFIAIASIIAAVSVFGALSLHRPNPQAPLNREKLVSKETVNLTSSRSSLFWVSNNRETGWVEYGLAKDALPLKAYDDRDLITDPKQYRYHIATLDNLTDDTDYYYRIVTKKGVYQSDGNTVFRFHTPKKNMQIANAKPAYGKILLPNGNPSENILVYLQVPNKYPMVAISKQTGEWLIPLNSLTDIKPGNSGETAPETTRASLDFFSEDGKTTRINAVLSNLTPLSQTVFLGRNYSMLARSDVLGASASEPVEPGEVFSVIYPRENALIPAGKPLIKGTGVPGADVFVFINSKPQYAYRATVDKKGEWRVLPTQDIGAGPYIASVTSKDEKGGKITVNRNFIIAKSGEQVLGAATGEPTIVPSPTTIPVLTVVPTTSPAPTTIAYISPTPMPTYAVNPTIPPIQNPTAIPQPPRSGVNFSYLLFVGIAFLITGGGLLLVF